MINCKSHRLQTSMIDFKYRVLREKYKKKRCLAVHAIQIVDLLLGYGENRQHMFCKQLKRTLDIQRD
jgi:hypothetical protein